MNLGKLQIAGLPDGFEGLHLSRQPERNHALLYSGIALGVLAGAAVTTYLWMQRSRALNLLNASPFDRAEELINSCESKIEDIERAIEELKEAKR
ncbi:MAG TPA: hypothetical protein VF719_12575 [Abditibacteriaceae bacterium]|jgi:hypothetical protein